MPVVLSSVQSLGPKKCRLNFGLLPYVCNYSIVGGSNKIPRRNGCFEENPWSPDCGVLGFPLAHGWMCFSFNPIRLLPLPANGPPGSILDDPIIFGCVRNLGWWSRVKLWVSLQHHPLAFKENSSEIRREGRRQYQQIIQPYKIPGLWFQPTFHPGAARGTRAVWLASASNQKVPQACKVY